MNSNNNLKQCMMSDIMVCTSDNVVIKMNMKYARLSSIINDLISDVCEITENPIQLPYVSSVVFTKIIEFCDHYYKHTEDGNKYFSWKAKNPHSVGCFDDWTSSFFDIPMKEHIDIIIACDYLQINTLYDISIAVLADKYLNDKSTEDIIQSGILEYIKLD